mmetsp:Transcript_76156/g.215815  ORF Transcript_76156/g.215815 Transcript_76156/m.215815 type:complete len:317 (-) Transcript_76156:93-1043(-)
MPPMTAKSSECRACLQPSLRLLGREVRLAQRGVRHERCVRHERGGPSIVLEPRVLLVRLVLVLIAWLPTNKIVHAVQALEEGDGEQENGEARQIYPDVGGRVRVRRFRRQILEGHVREHSPCDPRQETSHERDDAADHGLGLCGVQLLLFLLEELGLLGEHHRECERSAGGDQLQEDADDSREGHDGVRRAALAHSLLAGRPRRASDQGATGAHHSSSGSQDPRHRVGPVEFLLLEAHVLAELEPRPAHAEVVADVQQGVPAIHGEAHGHRGLCQSVPPRQVRDNGRQHTQAPGDEVEHHELLTCGPGYLLLLPHR